MVPGGGDFSGGIRQLRELISEHPHAIEADLIRAGVRLRWLGDGTDRFTIRDLSALVRAAATDRSSTLFRALSNDDGLNNLERLAIDQLNAVLLLRHTLVQVNSQKKIPKFEPLRDYAGSPWRPQVESIDFAGSLGGWRRMSPQQAWEWAQARGLPMPKEA